jgi:hypothetical protein
MDQRSWATVSGYLGFAFGVSGLLLCACSAGNTGASASVGGGSGDALGGAHSTGGAQGQGGSATTGSAGAEVVGGNSSALGGAAATGGNSGAPGGAAATGGASGAVGCTASSGGATSTSATGGRGSNDPTHFNIDFDYRFDTQNTFTAERRATLEAAARIWASHIQDEFFDVPAGPLLRARNPEHINDAATVFSIDRNIDDLLLFTALAEIDGPSGYMANAGTASTNQVVDDDLWQALVARFDGNPHQPWVGTIAFDSAEDWFFDQTPESDSDIPLTNHDFLTTALHEIGHTLGLGSSSEAFKALVVNGQFTGAHAVALYGGPVPMYSDGVHIALDVRSGGVECLMNPSTTAGIRRLPTPIDLAMLEDIGYHIVP